MEKLDWWGPGKCSLWWGLGKIINHSPVFLPSLWGTKGEIRNQRPSNLIYCAKRALFRYGAQSLSSHSAPHPTPHTPSWLQHWKWHFVFPHQAQEPAADHSILCQRKPLTWCGQGEELWLPGTATPWRKKWAMAPGLIPSPNLPTVGVSEGVERRAESFFPTPDFFQNDNISYLIDLGRNDRKRLYLLWHFHKNLEAGR